MLDLARWQFGITTIYHFVMVPLTIGLSLLVAAMQTAWVRTGNPVYYRMTKFWGKLMLINFSAGVVTGIVQEFQFGMAWSGYSRYVGDVIGAPLAIEGIVAFFVESTFLGLWIFGWDKLHKRVHLGCIWAAALASTASAYFILAANSWMQHPVGIEIVDGRPVMNSIWQVLTNSTLLAAFPHTMFGAFAVAGAFLLGIAAWKLHRGRGDAEQDRPVWLRSLRIGAWVGLIAFAGLAITGDSQAKLMFDQQPLKMASAEALCHTEQPASFSIFAVGDVNRPDCEGVKSLTVPSLLSFLADNSFTTEVRGIDDLRQQYSQAYGDRYPDDPAYGQFAGEPIRYHPNLPVTYWGFRLMIGFGAISAAACAAALWLTRRQRLPGDGNPRAGRWFTLAAVAGIGTPFAANIAGWVFTEMGRQPFVVAPNPTGVDGVFQFTAGAVSGVSAGEVLTSLIGFTVVYGLLTLVEGYLMWRFVRAGLPAVLPGGGSGTGEAEDDDETTQLSFAY